MNSLKQFLRMARWARHPPSTRRVVIFLTVLAVCLMLFAVERFIGWPDWLKLERQPNGMRLK